MTFKYDKVYLNETYTVVGPYEDKGPLGKYFDNSYEDLYCEADSWEKAETKLLEESMKKALRKNKLTKENIDLVISGDLLNQVTSSCYAASKINKPFLGIYSACASNVEGLIIGSNFINSGIINNCLCGTSSHNMSSEKQFRNPTEYGAPKPETATFTATGGASAVISNKKSNIKIESATIGRIVDYNQKDALNMGAVMACAAADTLKRHLDDLNRKEDYYDLILTGDLGKVGLNILKEYYEKVYNERINKIMDAGDEIFLETSQYSGGSGPVCLPLVFFTKILKNKKYKKILIVGSGSLHNPTLVNQGKEIPAISHLVKIEVLL